VIEDGDVRYGEADGQPLLLDVRRGESRTAAPAPLLVWIHGGGWEAGDKRGDFGNALDPVLIEAGFVVASINYRLSGQARFPAQIHDAKASIRWLRANAAELGIDPDRIGVWGHSAGGHLAALLGSSRGLDELEGDSGSAGVSSGVQAVAAISAPMDFLAVPPRGDDPDPERVAEKLFGGPLEERRALVRLASPVTHVSGDSPPFLIVHGEDDEVVPVGHAQLLHDALVRCGVESTLVRLPQADHVLAAPALGVAAPDAWSDVGSQALAFFSAHLQP
jgi:acetyl esterase/lipase